jgi:molybdenum cofactor cytidylyltransferase
MRDTAIVILAAGNSSRLGRPKQLLQYRGMTMIEHVVDEAIRAGLKPVIVVTGSSANEVSMVLNNRELTIVVNEDWREGMGSGIRTGVAALMKIDEQVANVILSVCDQPYVSGDLFLQLIEKKLATGKDIVACTYEGTRGVPVLFGRKYFAALMGLKNEEGAKKLLTEFENDLALLPFERGAIDIDTQKDFLELQENNRDFIEIKKAND